MLETEKQILQKTAERALALAQTYGASHADVVATLGSSCEIKVADGKILQLQQGSERGLGLRVFVGAPGEQKLGFCSGSDWSEEGLRLAVSNAVAMAKQTAPDPCHGMADAHGHDAGAAQQAEDRLDLYDPSVEQMSVAEMIDHAHAIETAARAADARVRKFRDSGVTTQSGSQIFMATGRPSHISCGSAISAWCTAVAEDDSGLQTDVWYDSQAHRGDLQSFTEIGRIAATRAARMLGAKRIPTQRVPVIFEAAAAGGLLASLLGAIDGDAVRKGASFLAQALGDSIAAEALSMRDVPHRVRGLGSAVVDGEGLLTQDKTLLERGRLNMFLYDGYAARKAGKKPTASAQRGTHGLPHAGTFNLAVDPGTHADAEILRAAPRALLVTRGLGRGLNSVTGDYSRGINGLWLEHGEVVHAVQEATVAGNMLDMLRGIDMLGSDVHWRGSVGAPMLRIGEMMVSGA